MGKTFKLGQLAWINSRAKNVPNGGMLQCKSGIPDDIQLVVGTAVTIIRPALARDYGLYRRYMRNGRSDAKRLADESWLVLYDGNSVMIAGFYLNKRFYRPRKK